MFIDIGDARIYSTSFGRETAPVILGIGGWIGSWELWAEPFSILSRHWRTIAFDHRGAGATVAPIESISFARLVDDIFCVLDAYAVEQCVLAAESAGALAALGAALRAPQRIAGLVVVDGLYYREPITGPDPFLVGLREYYEPTLEQFVQACVPEADSEHIKRWGRQIIQRASQESAIALYLSTNDVDLRSELHRITQPTLVVHGDQDVLVSVPDAQWLAGTLPNSKLVVLQGAGHVPTLTRPAEVAGEISEFFRHWVKH